MRHSFASIVISTCVVSVAHCAIPLAPADYQTDDVITLDYDPASGLFLVDNPAGSDAAADAITTFELTSSEPFFTGPRPPGLFDGIFDVWTPTKAFRLVPDGFYDMQWPAGSVEIGFGGSVHEILTLNGSFLSGGALEPVDLCVCVPEPNSLVLIGLGALCLTGACRRRI